jgi:hypothetical protein
LKPTEKLWWFRYSIAVLVAGLCAYLDKLGFFRGSYGLAFILAVSFYVLTYLIAGPLLRIKLEQLPKRGRDLAFYGVFAYFIAWFVFWVFFYTLTKLFFA